MKLQYLKDNFFEYAVIVVASVLSATIYPLVVSLWEFSIGLVVMAALAVTSVVLFVISVVQLGQICSYNDKLPVWSRSFYWAIVAIHALPIVMTAVAIIVREMGQQYWSLLYEFRFALSLIPVVWVIFALLNEVLGLVIVRATHKIRNSPDDNRAGR